ncbi:MAG TPA: LptF/LptG family permease [Longimicrobiales bacterium]|nr:LptF/LptG family permease [Longimicrobiales bacterium]
MSTLDRYVAREFMRLFLLFALCAPLLFVLGDWTEKIDIYARQELPPTSVALGYLYQLPLFISWSFPVAALIATVFTVNGMTRHSEMTAAKAGGISFFRALRVLLPLGIVLTAIALLLSEIVPIGTRAKKEVLQEVERMPEVTRHDFVYTGPDGHIYTIRALNIDVPSMTGVTVERAEAGKLVLRISARDARWDSISGWTLHTGVYRSFDENGRENAFSFRSLKMAALTETPEQLMARPKEPEEMRYAELGRFIETVERSGTKPREMKVNRAQKIAIPMATMVIILFGAPLANSSARGGAAYGIGISLGITVFYMVLFRVTGAAGAAGWMHPDLAAWAPNALFAIAAVWLIARVRT